MRLLSNECPSTETLMKAFICAERDVSEQSRDREEAGPRLSFLVRVCAALLPPSARGTTACRLNTLHPGVPAQLNLAAALCIRIRGSLQFPFLFRHRICLHSLSTRPGLLAAPHVSDPTRHAHSLTPRRCLSPVCRAPPSTDQTPPPR
ncbi:hypothetical protein AAFF_G00268480 [Aldrovandia affinis]|uniref:Uncharacterized protein n=1 Tax=Aldrovandia affinis TaxID=143900 RepID=A0AAD7WTK8_9TELE|nr:hypothetical protein AAFF_G00268480 [Aldrovandia affinis]